MRHKEVARVKGLCGNVLLLFQKATKTAFTISRHFYIIHVCSGHTDNYISNKQGKSPFNVYPLTQGLEQKCEWTRLSPLPSLLVRNVNAIANGHSFRNLKTFLS